MTRDELRAVGIRPYDEKAWDLILHPMTALAPPITIARLSKPEFFHIMIVYVEREAVKLVVGEATRILTISVVA